MKTLDEVEPRTPISSLPFTVTTSGSYYLPSNLTTATDGIIIDADDGSIDLRGFTISGSGGAAADIGIQASGRTGVVERSGGIVGFGMGISLVNSNNCIVEDMAVTRCKLDGIRNYSSGTSTSAIGNIFSRCQISNVGEDRFQLLASGMRARTNGTVIRDCILSAIGVRGIEYIPSVGEINNTRIVDRTIQDTGSQGIGGNVAGPTSEFINTVIDSCTISDTGSQGISFDFSGIVRSLCISRCHISFAAARGINVDGDPSIEAEAIIIKDCVITDVTGAGTVTEGIRLIRTERSIIQDNYVTRIFKTSGGSLVSGGGYLTAVGGDNLVIRNTSVGNSPNFSIDLAGTSGPFVSAAGVLGSTSPAVHPWANFGL